MEDHTMPRDQPTFPVKAMVGLAGVLLLVVVIVVLQVLLGPTQPAAPSGRPGDELKRLRSQQHQLLSSCGWVDRAKGTVHIPVDRAMDLVVAERARGYRAPFPPTTQRRKGYAKARGMK